MKYASFYLGKNLFGLPISLIQELSRAEPVFPIAGHDKRIEGLMNLRGKVATVLNLRRCLKVSDEGFDGKSRMVVLATEETLSKEAKKAGLRGVKEPVVLLVDKIHNILTPESEEFYPTPVHLKSAYVVGIIKVEESLLTILSIPKLMKEILQEEEETKQIEN